MLNPINEKGCDISQNGAFDIKSTLRNKTNDSIYFLLLDEILIETIIASMFRRTIIRDTSSVSFDRYNSTIWLLIGKYNLCVI